MVDEIEHEHISRNFVVLLSKKLSALKRLEYFFFFLQVPSINMNFFQKALKECAQDFKLNTCYVNK